MKNQRLTRAQFLRMLSAVMLAVAGFGRVGDAQLQGNRTMEPSQTKMITRAIPVSGENLPVIGLGTWKVFDVGKLFAGPREKLTEVLRLFFGHGAKLIDSSPMYGRAEAVVGDLVASIRARDQAFLATKVWTTGREAGIAQMKRSVELLRTKTIDLIQIHNLVDWRTHLTTLRKMKETGEIRYLGITHYTSSAFPALAEVIEREQVDFVQLNYSIEEREAEERLLPLAIDRRVAVIVNRPFGSGDLFRRVRNKPLPAAAAEMGCNSWAELMLKFVISHPAVTCAIPATSDPRHMADDLAAGFGRLPDDSERQSMIKLWESL